MTKKKNKKPLAIKKRHVILTIISIFLLCSTVEYIEFLILKTDQTFLAENVICKLFMVAVLYVALKKYHWRWSDIGFRAKGICKSALFGLSLGVSTFFISYAVELISLHAMGQTATVRFFISNFALTGQNVMGVSFAAILICILGNILNVWAEESLFRGLFFKLAKQSFSVRGSNFFQALLFGMWHIVMVVEWVLDGSMNIPTAVIMALGYVLLAGVLAYEWGLCFTLTGTIWAGVFEHFFNNFITNSVHVVTVGGIDELQILRIVLSNILSLTFVLLLSRRKRKLAAQRLTR